MEAGIPGHLALLDRVLEVLAGTAPSFSQLCGMFPRSVGNSGAANVASKEAAKESPRTSKRPRASQGFLERPKASQDPERPRASQSVPERPTASHSVPERLKAFQSVPERPGAS